MGTSAADTAPAGSTETGGGTGSGAQDSTEGSSSDSTGAGGSSTGMGVWATGSTGEASESGVTSIALESSGGGGSTSTGEPSCDDPDEGAEPIALGDIVCGGDPVVVMGVMDGPTSPDLWAYSGIVPQGECNNEAFPEVNVSDGEPLYVCIWSTASCPVVCPDDATPDATQGNGCCGEGDLVMEIECDGNDSTDVLVSVADERAECRPYTLELRY